MNRPFFSRLLAPPDRSFFLFGPRGVGKSTWLKKNLPGAIFFDLLDHSLQLQLAQNPGFLEARAGTLPAGSWIVIDEIQKIPFLLDEVHRLIESTGWKFALCGSSARKLRKGSANLLAGRAVTRNLDAFVSKELAGRFDPDFSLHWGNLPLVALDPENGADILHSYFNTYIKEEIKEESIVRSLPPFLRFLSIAGMMNGQQVNGQNIAREAAVPRSSVDVYFSILEDTLLGHFLPAYRPGLKVREQTHPKFYWFDPGVARAAAGLLNDPPDRQWLGAALETLIFHELRVHNHISGSNRPIYFYRTASGTEIDFIVETRKRQRTVKAQVVCLEVKLAGKWNRAWEKSMRSFKDAGKIDVEKMIGIYTGSARLHYDGVDVLPLPDFLTLLHAGEIW